METGIFYYFANFKYLFLPSYFYLSYSFSSLEHSTLVAITSLQTYRLVLNDLIWSYCHELFSNQISNGLDNFMAFDSAIPVEDFSITELSKVPTYKQTTRILKIKAFRRALLTQQV